MYVIVFIIIFIRSKQPLILFSYLINAGQWSLD